MVQPTMVPPTMPPPPIPPTPPRPRMPTDPLANASTKAPTAMLPLQCSQNLQSNPQLRGCGRLHQLVLRIQPSRISLWTQKLRPALSCEPLPNHVLPLAHFGAISGVCDGGMVRNDHHNAGERSKWKHPTLRPEGPPCICWWLVKPDHRSDTFHSRRIGVSKGKLHI